MPELVDLRNFKERVCLGRIRVMPVVKIGFLSE